MQQPFYRRWWSYLTPITLEQTSSKFNNLLEVQLSKGRYMLSTENAIYSFSDLYDHYFDAFKLLNINDLGFEEVLALGLGLGSIPEMLEKHFKVDFYYTCIEADEEVIALAEKYVLHELKSGMDVVCADASDWVYITEQTFDLICVDIFVDDTTPSEFRELDFLEQCNDLLNDGGLVLYNCMTFEPKDAAKAQEFYDEVFKNAFAKSRILKLRCNWILVGVK